MTTGESLQQPRAGVWPQALLLLAVIFASRLVWYDVRIVRRELLEPGQLRAFFVAYAACMTPIIVLVLVRSLSRVVLVAPVWWFCGLAWFGLLPALAYGNSAVLVAQDLFKLSLLPAGYLAGRMVFVRDDGAATTRAFRFCSRLALCVVVLQAARFVLLSALKRPGAGFLYGTILDVLPATTFAAIALAGRGRGRLLAIAAAAVSLVLTIPGQKRTVLACLAVSFGVLLVKILSRRSVVVLSVSYLAVLAAAGAVLLGGVDALLESDALKRLTSTDVSTVVGTDSWRFFEIRTVAAQLDHGGPLAWLFGYGHGASFEIWHPVRGLQDVHSVHHTPAAMVFRYGLIGLLFYGALAAYAVRAVLRRERSAQRNGVATALAAKSYLTASLVASFVIFGFVDDVLVGVFLALVHAIDRPSGQARGQSAARRV